MSKFSDDTLESALTVLFTYAPEYASNNTAGAAGLAKALASNVKFSDDGQLVGRFGGTFQDEIANAKSDPAFAHYFAEVSKPAQNAKIDREKIAKMSPLEKLAYANEHLSNVK